ncbi:SH3 domain protein (macronuclear) [Tetrahymena thermophila SB210]|uniref:SH3 domain protein n=1 Tax=Tetrahymena thermophila (strain SB210) TaxID=312017 RepID=Q24GR1_TETTS|nr:SH3 domain protein [Tetrahymena thermophila SB210]EAS06946.1 SH3 domain protein [Tetrahymena thermophila SB210]|eukprot:XP_001027188.1 SH3 domain protein [Tetrahymena thermophila SB210]
MIVAIALCDFSQEIMNYSQKASQENKSQKTEDQMKAQNEDSPKIKEDSENNSQQQSIKLDETQGKDEKANEQNENNKEKKEQDNLNSIEQNKQSQNDTPDLKEAQNDEQKKDVDQQSQNEQQNQTKQEQNETQQQDNQTQQMQYLSFKKDDRIIVKYQHPNGWWWGCQLGIRDPKDGYFPSSYVKFSHQIGDDFDDSEKQIGEHEIENMGWNEYAQYAKKNAFDQEVDQQYEKFINESVDKKEQDLQKYLNPGIKGYKKVKIDPSQQDSYKNIQGSYFSQEGDAVYIPIKSQDPLDRAYRQLNHYFNYDSWNDQMNQQRQSKSKPNPNKKKEKNENKFLQKIK